MQLDLLVVGGGLIGVGCALAARRAGLRVTIVERNPPGQGTAICSGGFLSLQTKPPGLALDLARLGLERIVPATREQWVRLGFRRAGSLIVARDEDVAADLHRHVERLAAAGVPVSLERGDVLRALEPRLGPDVCAGSFCPIDAQVDPASLLGEWIAQALRQGVDFRANTPVVGFRVRGERVTAVRCGATEIAPGAVLLAAGSWTGMLARRLGLDLPIEPRRGALLRLRGPLGLRVPCLLGAEYLAAKFGREAPPPAFSLEERTSGWLFLGGTREFAGHARRPLAGTTNRLWALARAYLPAAARLRPVRLSVGFRPWTPDGLPLIGRAGYENLFVAAGHEGDGVLLAAITGELVVDALLGRTSPVPLGPLAPLRFAAVSG